MSPCPWHLLPCACALEGGTLSCHAGYWPSGVARVAPHRPRGVPTFIGGRDGRLSGRRELGQLPCNCRRRRSAVDSQSRISDISMHAERSVDQGKYSNTTRRHTLKRHIAVVAMHFPTVRCSCPSHPSPHVPRSRADAACLAPHPPPWPPTEWTKVLCFARCCKGHMCWI